LDNEPGLLGSARRVLATLLEIGQTRLQIASTELEEERLRLAELMLWATFSLFFLGVGLVLASLLLVMLFWEGQRELVLATISAVFLIVGAWAGMTWRRKSRNKPALLATTIAEFKRDRAALGGRSP